MKLKEYFIISHMSEEINLVDAIDWRLLDVLQRDASRTNQQLALDTYLSPATCLRCVQRLRQARA